MFNVLTIPPFDRQLKRLLKKYPSLLADFSNFIDDIEQNPFQGTELGKNCYKIRLAIKSKGKGKSGGGRIVTNLIVDEETIFLIAIYDKGAKETLSDKELKELLKYI